MPRIFILTGEPSGDLYAGLVARALKAELPSVTITGVGGPELRAAGVQLVEDIESLSVFGFWEGIKSYPRMRRFVRQMEGYLASERPDIFVPVSHAGVNLSLADYARRHDIRVVYVSPPQLWAWGKWRTRRLAASTDRVICLLPFEESFFRSLGVNATYLGNPLTDALAAYRSLPAALEKQESGIACRGSTPDKQHPRPNAQLPPLTPRPPSLVLMPGSRPSEVRSHLPVMLEVAQRLQSETPDLKIQVLASGELIRVARVAVPANFQFVIRNPAPTPDLRPPTPACRYSLMSRADLILVASGTATLEAAILQVPMIVLYHLSSLSLLTARSMVHLKHFSLPNLILDSPLGLPNPKSKIQNPKSPIVPEFLQPRADDVFACARDLLMNADKRADMRAALAQVTARLGETGAAQRIAREILAVNAQCFETSAELPGQHCRQNSELTGVASIEATRSQ